ncbi:IclR family transcriptional regulator [Azospirillum thermophilum]|uniref:IclR family transcriptional regulator n=1 Tax=Azospirillum thermophilum TaxID=2202148 RepID=A0A2S2CMI9_9PROT|nr:IclR family transcriptional regulator [Azospirillum thermophilum]AWK85728.1 IclR family transcriptional regulator [Azospirillum thermophilum]
MRRRDDALVADEPAADEEKDPRFVTALARGLELLRCFRKDETALGNQDFAERTGLPKPTVSRLTYTLAKLGYLVYDPPTGKYRLGTAVLALGYASLSGMGIRQVARPLMQEVASQTRLQVALGGRDRLSMIYLECCHGGGPITLSLDVGSHIKLGTSAMGRAYLAALPDAERTALMGKLEEHEGKRWPAVHEGILQAVEDYRTRGYCRSIGSWKSEVNAIGVPFVPRNGSAVLAFNCGGPAFLVDRRKLEEEYAPRLVAMVRRIDAALFNG